MCVKDKTRRLRREREKETNKVFSFDEHRDNL